MCRQAVKYLPKHKWDVGDYYAGQTHVCTNESFWKTTQEPYHEEGHWKKVMHARDNEIGWGVAEGEGNPNDIVVNCGHYEYSQIWPLYKQDQLQVLVTECNTDIMLDNGYIERRTLTDFCKFVFRPSPEMMCKSYPPFWIKTFEQLWLAFVMLNKYERVWIDEKWKKK